IAMNIHTAIISTAIFLIVAIGLFGNISFVFTVFRNRRIRTIRAYLLSILCLMHIIMLLHNIINVFRNMTGVQLSKQECIFALTIPPTIYAVSHQAFLYLILGIDVLVSLIFPSRYIRIRSLPYVLSLQVPCVLYSSSFITASAFYDDDRKIVACNPPDAFPVVVNRVRTTCGLAIGSIVLLIYLVVTIMLIR
ncbi:hypothetical protein PMAYCL1PPCAC_30977, partial [Pristionchus mayeri]